MNKGLLSLVASIPIDFSFSVLFKQAQVSDKRQESIELNDEMKLNEKGLALYLSGKNQEAILIFDRVLELSPNNIQALQNREIAL
jgi:tetratricopeptide (TPR) repeat protein